MTHWTLLRFGVLAVIVGLVVALAAHVILDRLTPTSISIAPATEWPITVMVDGAVATPGVVELPPGARLQDALDAVGGLTDDADPSDLNLASRLRDGDHISIPARPPQAPTQPDGAAATPRSQLPSSGLIDLNTAGVPELDTLPGIGPVIAQRIVDFRDFYGPFESIDQLVEIEGISPAMVDRIRPLVTVGG